VINNYNIEDLKSGSTEAFRRLVETSLDRVINICYRFVHNREEAEDLAQETFITVHQSIRRFRGDSNISTWIHQIAVRKSLDHLRKMNRQKRKGMFFRVLRLDNPEVEIAAPFSKDPHSDLENRVRRFHLQSALATLPQNQKTAFILSKCDGLSQKEVAKIMKTTVSSVTSLIHRAKVNLQVRLTKFYHDKG
jgi:RNA polymerase sigma-70 factor, ECF subfamily